MTGYGKAEASLTGGKLTVEIRTLNGKSADINIKTSLLPKDKELMVRQKLAERLHRGTIDFFLNFEANAAGSARRINADLAAEYFRQIAEIGEGLGVKTDSALYMNTILRFPDIMDTGRQDIITEDNWIDVESAIDEAIAKVNEYRAHEGIALYRDVTGRVQNILDLEDEVESFDPERIAAIRAKIGKAIASLFFARRLMTPSQTSSALSASREGYSQEMRYRSRILQLQNIHRLLADLLQLVLHADDDLLDAGVVRLGAGRVDFPAHLLDNEAKLLSRIFLIVNGVDEVFAVLAEADLLLVDVELLEIIDHFLLEAALVRLQGEFLDGLAYFRPDCGDSLRVEGLHLILQVENVLDTARDIPVEGNPLVSPVFVDLCNGLVNGRLDVIPVIFRDDVLTSGVHNVREPQNSVHIQGRVGLYAEPLPDFSYLAEVFGG